MLCMQVQIQKWPYVANKWFDLVWICCVCYVSLLQKKIRNWHRKQRRAATKPAECHTRSAVADQGQIHSETAADPQITTRCQILSGSVYSVDFGAKTPHFTAFQNRHPVVAPPSGLEIKLNAGAQKNPSPIQWYQNHFMSSKAFTTKSLSQTWPFRAWRTKTSNFFRMLCSTAAALGVKYGVEG